MKVLSITLVLATLFSTSSAATATWVLPDLTQWTKSTPYNTKAPASTPAFVALTPPPANKYLAPAQLAKFVTATTPFVGSSLYNVAVSIGFTPTGGFAPNPAPPGQVATPVVTGLAATGTAIVGLLNGHHYKEKRAAAASCLDSTANDTVINSLYYYGASTVYLCPTAVIKLNSTVFFYSQKQTLTTQANNAGNRGTLQVANVNMSCAIFAVGSWTNGATLSNIIVDGQRPQLGVISGGNALLELAGDSQSLTISNIRTFEPRGWSAMHLLEGNNLDCMGAKITNNQVGPSGNSPTGAAQFRKRGTTYAPGLWADGISCACAGSTITGNVVTDATDGGIVIFGAPGTTVSGNQIVTATRNLLGGINMVDIQPWGGNYTGTVVSGNTLTTTGAFMKVGIAVGTLTWSNYNQTWARNIGGSIIGNTLTSTSSNGYFGFGISVSGHNGTKATGNVFSKANFGGVANNACLWYNPDPQPLVYCPYTTTGSTFQSTFNSTTFNFLICNGPGPIVKASYTLTKGTRRSDLVGSGKKRARYGDDEYVDEFDSEDGGGEYATDFILIDGEREEEEENLDELSAIRARHLAKVKSMRLRRGIH